MNCETHLISWGFMAGLKQDFVDVVNLKYVCVEYQRKNWESAPDSISFQCLPLICF